MLDYIVLGYEIDLLWSCEYFSNAFYKFTNNIRRFVGVWYAVDHINFNLQMIFKTITTKNKHAHTEIENISD